MKIYKPSKATIIRIIKAYLPLIMILLFALFMRLTNMVGPVRGDDFTYLSAANDIRYGEINYEICCGLRRVGIWWPISIVYTLFGVNETTSILFPLLSSLATVVFIYGIGRLLKNEATGLIAAVLWAAFPLDILSATQVYPDAIAVALASGAVLSVLLAFHHRLTPL